MKDFKFVNEEGRWFVELDNWQGDRGDLEMVLGADTMLDILAQGEGEVDVTLSEEKTPCRMTLSKNSEDEFGALYILTSEDSLFDFSVWLCPVTVFVFGYYPEKLYIS